MLQVMKADSVAVGRKGPVQITDARSGAKRPVYFEASIPESPREYNFGVCTSKYNSIESRHTEEVSKRIKE
jgi:hypothetical protein